MTWSCTAMHCCSGCCLGPCSDLSGTVRRRPATKKPAIIRLSCCRAVVATTLHTVWMFDACFPLGPCVTSKLTFCPSFSDLNPGMLIAEKGADRSSPPPSGVMKPKPLASLNHLTVPVGMFSSTNNQEKNRVVPCRCFDLKDRKVRRFGNCQRAGQVVL